MKREYLEIQRHNVTPSQFLAYVRRQIRKHNLTTICAEDIDLNYFAAGNDLNFSIDNRDKPDAPCMMEKSISKPYEYQTYVKNWDGTVYNNIIEFSFDDEKKGYGYFFFVNTWNE